MPSSDILSEVEAAYRAHFESEPQRASVSFLGVEPIEVLRFADTHQTVYVTVGMARHPMTSADADVVDDSSGPRAELLLRTNPRVSEDSAWRRLAVLAAAPAVEGVVYTAGGRVDLTEAWTAGSRCTGAVLTRSALAEIAVGEEILVEVYEVLPTTSNELAWAKVHGSEKLIDRWRDEATDLSDLFRDPVGLA